MAYSRTHSLQAFKQGLRQVGGGGGLGQHGGGQLCGVADEDRAPGRRQQRQRDQSGRLQRLRRLRCRGEPGSAAPTLDPTS